MKNLVALGLFSIFCATAHASVEVSTANFEAEVLKSQKPVLVEFYRAGCVYCERMAPILDLFERENSDAKVVRINGDTEADLRQKLKLTNTPTFLVYQNGKMTGRFIGYMPIEALSGKFYEPKIEAPPKRPVAAGAPQKDTILKVSWQDRVWISLLFFSWLGVWYFKK